MKLKLADYEAIVLVLENDRGFYRRYTGEIVPNKTMGQRRSIIGDACWNQHAGLPAYAKKADIEDRDQMRRYFDDRYGIKTEEANKYAHIPSVWGPEPEPLPPMNPALKPFVKKLTERYSHTWALAQEESRRKAISYWAAVLGYSCYTDAQFPQVAAAIQAVYAEQSTQPKLPVHVPGCPIPIPSPEYHAEWLAPQTQASPEDITMNAPTILTVETRTFVNGDDVAKMSDSQVYDLIAAQEAAIEKLNEIKAKPKKLVEEIAKRQAGIAALVAHLDKAA